MKRLLSLVAGMYFLAPVCFADPVTVFVQAEDFDNDGESWVVRDQASRYAPDSGLRHLHGAADVEGTATMPVTLPTAGVYTVWVRHSVMRGGPEINRGAFRLEILRDGDVIAAHDFDTEPPQDPPQRIHRYDWNRFAAQLPAGEVTLRLGKLPPPESSHWTRMVDCLVLTTDDAYEPDVADFQPKIWMRVTLGDTPSPPVYIHCFANRFRAPYYMHFSLSKTGFEPSVRPSGGPEVFLNPGESTPWCDITSAIHEDTGCRLELRGAEVYSYEIWRPELDAIFEFATAPDEAAIVKTFRKKSEGAGLSIITPGVLNDETAHLLMADYEYCAENAALMERLTMPAYGARPERFAFMIGMGLRRPLYDPQLRRTEYEIAARMGFNGSYDPPDPLIESLGFTHYRAGTGAWFRTDNCYAQPETERIRQRIATGAESWSGPSPIFIKMMDEPYANDLAHVVSCPACSAAFVPWLRDELGLSPEQLGVAGWAQVRPVSTEQRDEFPQLYYYSQHLRSKLFADFLRLQTESVNESWSGPPPATVNFSDGTVYNAGMFENGVDYFHIFRSGGLSMAWSEDWTSISSTYQLCGYNSDIMRAAVRGTDTPIGMYLITSYGRTPLDIKLKGYSSISRDARVLMSFAYGPHYSGHEPNWYLREEVYPAIAELGHEIGAAEDLLMDARRPPAEVALLYSTASDIWAAGRSNLFGHERMHTWLALTHAQVPVDILDEKDVQNGELAHMRVLYLCTPNLPSAAVEPIAAWVRAGGVLYLSAGGATADEYNRPSRALDEALGIRRGETVEHELRIWPSRYIQRLALQGQVTLASAEEVHVLGASQPLADTVPPDAEVLARHPDNTPAALRMKAGEGEVFVVGFMPALSYIHKALSARDAAGSPAPEIANQVQFEVEADDSNIKPHEATYNPWQYSAGEREFICAPVTAAGVIPPVRLNVPVVEAGCVAGEAGMVITLANYAIMPVDSLQVTVRPGRETVRAESVRHGELAVQRQGGDLVLTLPLETTDIIKLYYAVEGGL